MQLPSDRRQQLHDLSRDFLRDLQAWGDRSALDDEFFLTIVDELRQRVSTYCMEISYLRAASPLRPSEESILAATYHKAGNIARQRHMLALADWLYIEEQDATLRYCRLTGRRQRALGLAMLRIASLYGTSIRRYATSISLLAIGFAAIAYPFLDFGEKPRTFLSAIYWSIVTLTTLGYGDVTPSSSPGQIIVIAAAVSGAVMLGVLLHLITRRTLR